MQEQKNEETKKKEKLDLTLQSTRFSNESKVEQQKQLKQEHARLYELLRVEKQEKIDTLEDNLRRCQQSIVTLESTVLSLNTIITEKKDVEKERDMWIERHDDIENQKTQLNIQLQGASDYILQLENKCYEVNQE